MTAGEFYDLFAEGDYLELFNKTFSTSLEVSDLPQGDRIVKRLETKHDKFVHGEVAETLLRNYSDSTFTDTTLDRFAALIDALTDTTLDRFAALIDALNATMGT